MEHLRGAVGKPPPQPPHPSQEHVRSCIQQVLLEVPYIVYTLFIGFSRFEMEWPESSLLNIY